ncbi:hypothetical protein J2T12_000875 [Paenibacillus anaericanus]|uniref:hypothetical protein n=1 Tax=Paenibacillus anaericanus TaxID=170367 RepID=UPI00277F7AE7|nr:hypothetical protein [Paenibacillus anaericanus]MDQ0087481.1 hypothetical protein [Paenibacillus anaericanus]
MNHFKVKESIYVENCKTHMDAKVVDKLEGIYSRYWTFESDNISFKLMYHEDTGNCLCPSESLAQEL